MLLASTEAVRLKIIIGNVNSILNYISFQFATNFSKNGKAKLLNDSPHFNIRLTGEFPARSTAFASAAESRRREAISGSEARWSGVDPDAFLTETSVKRKNV